MLLGERVSVYLSATFHTAWPRYSGIFTQQLHESLTSELVLGHQLSGAGSPLIMLTFLYAITSHFIAPSCASIHCKPTKRARGAAREESHAQLWYRVWQFEDTSVAFWLKHNGREPKLRLSLVQSLGSSTSAQPRPHLLVWQGLGACRHPGRAPCGSPGQQAGQPGVLGEQAARTIQGSGPLLFRVPAQTSFVNNPLATVA